MILRDGTLVTKVVNNTLRVWNKMTPPVYGLNRREKRDVKIILSLTTFPKRFPQLPQCLNSLLHQSMKPDRIIVWLDDFVTDDMLGESLKKFEKYGVEFCTAPYDLRPHKKYLHAMQALPDDIVITVDDDLVYPPTIVKSLYESYLKHPNCVSARRCHLMKPGADGFISSYNDFEGECTSVLSPSHALFACGVGGVLYPPHLLVGETFNIAKIQQLSLTADDVWLKFMELKSNTKVVWVKCSMINPPVVRGSQVRALNQVNVGQNRNDVILQNLKNAYPEVKEILWS